MISINCLKIGIVYCEKSRITRENDFAMLSSGKREEGNEISWLSVTDSLQGDIAVWRIGGKKRREVVLDDDRWFVG